MNIVKSLIHRLGQTTGRWTQLAAVQFYRSATWCEEMLAVMQRIYYKPPRNNTAEDRIGSDLENLKRDNRRWSCKRWHPPIRYLTMVFGADADAN